tara:strand:+ start:433 stop:612 length:180 start_codon:yes stop_codon:yes gene_type:complete
MKMQDRIKIGLSYHSHEPVKYKIDKELFEKFKKEFEKGKKPIIRNLLSKSPDFINNLLK